MKQEEKASDPKGSVDHPAKQVNSQMGIGLVSILKNAQKLEFAEKIYFIKQGKIKIYAENGFPIRQVKDGQNFREVEVIFKEPRMGEAVAVCGSLVYTMEGDDLDLLFDEFKDVKSTIITRVKKQREKLRALRDQAESQSPIFNKIREHFALSIFSSNTLPRFGMNRQRPGTLGLTEIVKISESIEFESVNEEEYEHSAIDTDELFPTEQQEEKAHGHHSHTDFTLEGTGG